MKNEDYLVEISATIKKFFVLIVNRETQEGSLIDLYYRQGERLMKELDFDYKQLVKQIGMKFGSFYI